MKNYFARFLLLLLLTVAPPALGQYRDFTNQDGRVIVAIPLSKTADSVKIQSKDGNNYTVLISKLSDADQQFVIKWVPPTITNRVIAFSKSADKNASSPDPLRDFYFTLGSKGASLEFAAFQRQELIDALKEFIRRCGELNKAENPDYLKTDLTSLNGKYKDSATVWQVILRKESIQLFASGPGRFPDHMKGVKGSVDLDIAPYILDYLTDFDAEGAARKYLETAKKIKGSK